MQAARALTLSSTALRRSHNRGRVLTGTGTAISNKIGRYQSFAAQLQSQIEQEPHQKQKTGKKISKHVRRSMVIAFIHKYRASNAGKYPTKKETQKQVGGSYYTIKSIMEEFEHNSKHAATVLAENGETLTEACVPSQKVRDAQRSVEGADLTDHTLMGKTTETQPIFINNIDIDKSSSYSSQVKEKIVISSSEAASNSEVKAETPSLTLQNIGVSSNSDKTHAHQIDLKNKERPHLCTKEPQKSKERAAFDDSLVLDESKIVKEDSTEPEKSALPKGMDEERQSSVWGSIRSFADGIVKLWRNM